MRLYQKIHKYRKILINKINDIKDILTVMDHVEERVLSELMERQTSAEDPQAEFNI
jgi:hypothetical protein